MKITHGVKAGVILWITAFLLSCAATEDIRILDQENRQNASQLKKLQGDMETLQSQLSSLQKESQQEREAMSKEDSTLRADLLLRIENLESELKMLTAGVEEYKDFAKKPSKEIDRLKEDLAFRTKILEERSKTLEEKNKTLEERARASEEMNKGLEEKTKEIETRLKAVEDYSKQLDSRLEQVASKPSESEKASAERASPTGAGNLYRDAYETLQKGDMEGARRKFEAFLKQYPNTELSDNAQFWIGETYYQKKDYEKAILEYEKVIVTYPEGEKVSSALFKQALAFLELGDKTNARNLLKRVIERYPHSDQAEMASKRLETLQ